MSLGSWVAPLAARRSPDVAFIIAESAPALTPIEHERFRVERQLRADGFPREVVARARSFMEQKFKVARTGQGWTDLTAAMGRAAREGWISYINPPSSLENLQWHWTHVLSYDPLPVLEQLDLSDPGALRRAGQHRAGERASGAHGSRASPCEDP